MNCTQSPPPMNDMSALLSVLMESTLGCSSAAISRALASTAWQTVASMIESSKRVIRWGSTAASLSMDGMVIECGCLSDHSHVG